MIKCDYCAKELKNKASFGVHSKNCIEYKSIINSLTKEKLIDLYINKQMSAVDIQKFFNLKTYALVYQKLKEFDIEVSFKNSAKKCKAKREKTNLEKYGTHHNFCRGSESRKKWEEKLFKEEGISNVFQRKEVKEKIRNTMIEKYKKESPQKIHTCRGKNIYSKIHRSVVEILQKNNIKCSIEYKISKNNGYYSYDIVIDETNKLIEVYGDYWHGNPKIYKDSDIILKGSSREITVKEKRKFDKKKINFAKKLGHEILIIWEYDLNNNYDKTKNEIIKFSNHHQ